MPLLLALLLLFGPSGVDYQLGGAYEPPAGVGIVARDRHASAVSGAYNICYVNAFQTQPQATGWWRREHPRLVLPVEDRQWREWLLDTRRPRQLLKVVGPWIDTCAAKPRSTGGLSGASRGRRDM